MRVEITWWSGSREYAVQGEVDMSDGSVALMDAWDLDDGHGGWDVLDVIESDPRALEYVKGAMRDRAGCYADAP